MHHLSNVLLKTISREELVLALSKNIVCLPMKSSSSQTKALLNIGAPCGITSSIVALNCPNLQCSFIRVTPSVNSSHPGAHCASRSVPEMAPIVQGEIIVIMGISGAGKTTIGTLLAEAMNCSFLDADDFHPDSNKEKMRNGIPLSEEDRMPWLQVLCNALRDCITAGNTAVLACSALQKKYRKILRSSDPNNTPGRNESSLKFVLLNVPVEVLADRLNNRLAKGDHFMPPSLLQSQLELLEVDASEGILEVDATQSPTTIVETIQDSLMKHKIL